MRITVKSIIKWGLIAEIITAIVGQIGEFTLRYRAYSYAFDELFGSYHSYYQQKDDGVELGVNNNGWDSTLNHSLDQSNWTEGQLEEHRLGRSYRRPSTIAPYHLLPTIYEHQQNSSIDSEAHSTSFFHSVWSNIFSSSIKPVPYSSHWNESSESIPSIVQSLDPRPIVVCGTLVLLNLAFVGAILYEYLPLICPLTVVWLLYLILVLLILHAGTTGISSSPAIPTSSTITTSLNSSSFGNQYRHSDGAKVWATLIPSPFTILVISIILVFSLVFIAIIVEERRQIAYRVRAKSAAIPLVKSRDMDLDEI